MESAPRFIILFCMILIISSITIYNGIQWYQAYNKISICQTSLEESDKLLIQADEKLEECQILLHSYLAAEETCEIYNKVLEVERIKDGIKQ